jgi:hypothetical protein
VGKTSKGGFFPAASRPFYAKRQKDQRAQKGLHTQRHHCDTERFLGEAASTPKD